MKSARVTVKRIKVKDPYDEGFVTLRSARVMHAIVLDEYRLALKQGNAYKAQTMRNCVRNWSDAILSAVKLALVTK